MAFFPLHSIYNFGYFIADGFLFCISSYFSFVIQYVNEFSSNNKNPVRTIAFTICTFPDYINNSSLYFYKENKKKKKHNINY